MLTAFVFGSVAAGTDTVGSDIDLMVISDELDYPEVIRLLASAEEQIGRSINPVVYGRDEWRRKAEANVGFIQRVMEKQKVFLIGSENDIPQPGESRQHWKTESRKSPAGGA
jgi:predicted nucleotidyltransferase